MHSFRERLNGVNSPYTIMLRFIDKLLFVWAPNGRPSRSLPSLCVGDGIYDDWTKDRSDMETIANLFAARTNFLKYFSLSISHSGRIDALTTRFRISTIDNVEGRLVRSASYDRIFEKLMIEAGPADLKYRTACIAREKLRQITKEGKDKIFERRFDRLVTPWPYFELFDGRQGKPTYEGKWFYAEPHVMGDCERCRRASLTQAGLSQSLG
ncbi:MAG: hypothetical protein L6R37_005518 [Teloschistes peruensis]|nr:MAG: hypothetical protein L6R37_005518 [Teloschistes peruensis]